MTRTSGHRVVATGSPGMTPSETARREPGATQAAVHLHRLERVGRAGGVIAADLPVERADHRTVGAQESHEYELHGSTRPTQCARSTRSSSYDDDAAAGSARTTSTAEPGSTARCSRARCRRRRFTRLRTTALPTALLTTSPTRAGASSSATDPRWTTTVREPDRRPRVAARNESASASRWSGDSNAAPARTAGRPSDGQALAALAAARGEDGATRTGAHAQAETVDLVTATVVRLVRTLAHELLFRWVFRPLGPADRRCPSTARRQAINTG